MMDTDFVALPLHDATLRSVTLNWGTAECDFRLRTSEVIHVDAGLWTLRFRGVRGLHVPHLAAWGHSSSVNILGREGDDFAIEMQSGDTITVTADEFVFLREAGA